MLTNGRWTIAVRFHLEAYIGRSTGRKFPLFLFSDCGFAIIPCYNGISQWVRFTAIGPIGAVWPIAIVKGGRGGAPPGQLALTLLIVNDPPNDTPRWIAIARCLYARWRDGAMAQFAFQSMAVCTLGLTPA